MSEPESQTATEAGDTPEVDHSECDSDPKGKNSDKITILVKAAGNAPIMKKKKWVVPPDKTVAYISNFFRKYLHLTESESLFLYVNQSFAPSPDQILKNLYECFGTDGILIIHYCKTQAWG